MDKYKALHPNVDIEIIVKPSGEYTTWLSAQFAAGMAPDVITYSNPQDINFFNPKNKYTIDFKP